MTQLEAPLRAADLRLAGLHLRMGAHQLARAELEALAGANALDPAALLDLADARWRTGDLAGAGVAAQAYLGEGGEAVLAYVIAAESSHASGRATEARRLASEALGRADVPLDRLFAGMPRSGVWPIGTEERPEPVAELFPAAPWAPALAVSSPAAVAPGVVGGAGVVIDADAASGEAMNGGVGLWDRTEGGPGDAETRGITVVPGAAEADRAAGEASGDAASDDAASGGLDDAALAIRATGREREPADELAIAWGELATGRHDLAAIRLALVLRRSPGLASAVLDAIDSAPPARDSAVALIELLRGDALRAAGRELEARASWRAAAAAVAPTAERGRPADEHGSAAPPLP